MSEEHAKEEQGTQDPPTQSARGSQSLAKGGVGFEEMGLRNQFRDFGAALARGFEIPDSLMRTVPEHCRQVVEGVDEDGNPKTYTQREILAAGRLARQLAKHNLDVEIARLQGALVQARMSEPDDEGEPVSPYAQVVIELPHNARD